MNSPAPHIAPFLMFTGKAEEAMNFYVATFPRSEVLDIKRYGKGAAGPEGTIEVARFSLNGQTFMCIDSPIPHGFTFTPAISLYVTCESEAEVDRIYARLADGGSALMPLGAYPFSKRFGWVADRYGVTWQLTLSA
jgi:predicted 3-demethylubiquinone-9 3-methyltransferase (glyoxalase superfamily)